ncbi:MAG: UDP-4-amino-4,6-dideoxy-N-acetyl-beta-L-altrosamine N-acetyltransferase [Deltaproteobacteria bacterium]|nr:UDP-4-amino-4,6-dideoxy-N-acetyl-beta-L-altrosamine N-acetyltransferase [Deltaproteobacteria bacterium]
MRKILANNSDTDFIIALRNHPQIKQYFFSMADLTKEGHFKYLEAAEKRGDLIFIVEKLNKPIGQIAITAIDQVSKRASSGLFALQPELMGSGLGAFVEYNILSYVFAVLKLDRLYVEVMDSNIAVRHLHEGFGFQLEGILRKHIVINAQAHDVYYYAMLKEEWNEQRFARIFGQRILNEPY